MIESQWKCFIWGAWEETRQITQLIWILTIVREPDERLRSNKNDILHLYLWRPCPHPWWCWRALPYAALWGTHSSSCGWNCSWISALRWWWSWEYWRLNPETSGDKNTCQKGCNGKILTRRTQHESAPLFLASFHPKKFVIKRVFLTSSGSFRPAKMFPFSLWFCLLGLFSLGDVSKGGGGGGGGGATLSLVGEIVSSNQSPKMGSLSSSAKTRTHIWNEWLHEI